MTEVKQNQGPGCPRQRTETGCHRQIRQFQAVWQQEGQYGVTNILHGEARQSFKHGGHTFYTLFSPNDPIPPDVTHWCDPADVTCVTHLSGLTRSRWSGTKTSYSSRARLIGAAAFVILLVQAVLLTGPPFLSSYLIFSFFLPPPHQIPGPDPAHLTVAFSCVSKCFNWDPTRGWKEGVEEPEWHRFGARCPTKLQHQAIP